MASKKLRPSDLLVEFRDNTLTRQGSIPSHELLLKMQPVFNGVGSWSITLPNEHRAVPYLRAPGSGIIVTNKVTGQVVLSGATSKPSKRQTNADPKGMATLAGLTDDRLLWDARAFPDVTSADVGAQGQAYDIRSGLAEAIMRQYVDYNIGTSAQAGRMGGFRNAIVLGAAGGLGSTTITKRARFDVLGELLKEIAAVDGLGFRLVQVGSTLEFQVYQPQDRTALIRLDVTKGTLSEQSVEFAPPEVTREIVAGQGEGVERQFVQVTTADSLQAESDWGLIIEEFKDQRNTDDIDELNNAGLEELTNRGFTKTAIKAVPANDQTMVFMQDFGLGDKITTVIDGQEPNSVITEAAIVVDTTGVTTAIAIGSIKDFDSTSALRQTVTDNTNRISNLERVGGLLPARLSEAGKEVDDLDDATVNGKYWTLGGANVPPGGGTWWMVDVVTHPGSIGLKRIMQTAREANGSRRPFVWSRYWNGSSWTQWELAPGTTIFQGEITTDVSAANNTFEVLGYTVDGFPWDRTWDPLGIMLDAGTYDNRLYPPYNGWWTLQASVRWQSNGTGLRAIRFRQDYGSGASTVEGGGPQVAASDNSEGQFSAQVDWEQTNAGDATTRLWVDCRQTSGGTIPFYGGKVRLTYLGPLW